MSIATVINGDARRLPLADGSVHMVCTSPPYFGLRDYGTATWEGGDPGCDHGEAYRAKRQAGRQSDVEGGVPGSLRDKPVTSCKCGARRVDRQIGLEATPSEFVAAMVQVFREVRRVLHPTGVCFVNLGDSYNSGTQNNHGKGGGMEHGQLAPKEGWAGHRPMIPGLKPKDMIGIPWRVALALQADGWWLRDAIIWSKAEVDDDDVLEGSAMPGSQRDRCTSAYEMVFQLAKSERYYFDAEAIKSKSGAMPRNVWRINPSPWKGAHFATFSPALVERCVKAGTSERGCCPECGAPWQRVVDGQKYEPEVVEVGARFVDASRGDKVRKLNGKSQEWRAAAGSRQTLAWHLACSCPARDPVPATILDPFCGSGTTGVVATGLGRRFVGVDLSPNYCRMAVRRISRPHASHRTPRKEESYPLFAGVAE